MEGNPIGFQRWVNADNAIGIVNNKTYERVLSLFVCVLDLLNQLNTHNLESSYNFDIN